MVFYRTSLGLDGSGSILLMQLSKIEVRLEVGISSILTFQNAESILDFILRIKISISENPLLCFCK